MKYYLLVHWGLCLPALFGTQVNEATNMFSMWFPKFSGLSTMSLQRGERKRVAYGRVYGPSPGIDTRILKLFTFCWSNINCMVTSIILCSFFHGIELLLRIWCLAYNYSVLCLDETELLHFLATDVRCIQIYNLQAGFLWSRWRTSTAV